MSQPEGAENALRYGSRYPSTDLSVAARVCPVCGGPPPSSRSVYCKTACKQLQRQRLLVAHTVYECPRCLRFVSSKSTSTKDGEG